MECIGKCLCSREGVRRSCSNKLLLIEAVVVHHSCMLACNDRMTGNWCPVQETLAGVPGVKRKGTRGIYNLHFKSFSNVHHFIR